jgi:hypothetical protein
VPVSESILMQPVDRRDRRFKEGGTSGSIFVAHSRSKGSMGMTYIAEAIARGCLAVVVDRHR